MNNDWMRQHSEQALFDILRLRWVELGELKADLARAQQAVREHTNECLALERYLTQGEA